MPTLLEMAQEQVKRDALNDLLATGLLAGGLGVGFRALQSRRDLFSGTPASNEAEKSLALSQPLQVAMPVYDSRKDQQAANRTLGTLNKAAEGELGSWGSNFAAGNFANTKEQIPWYLPGMLGTALVSGFGGYKLADRLIQNKKKQDVRNEVDAARQEYQKALLSNFDPRKIEMETNLAKVAEAPSVGDQLGEQLDKLAALLGVTDATTHETALTKAANMLERGLGQALGTYGMYAIPASLLSGLAAYEYAKSRSGESVLEEAIRRRNRERAAMRAPDVSFSLNPVKVDRQGVLREKTPAAAPQPAISSFAL